MEYEVFGLNEVKLFISKEHRFGTDSLLLGEFAAKAGNSARVVDLCSGCGIIPVQLLHVNKIYAVEIQQEAVGLIERTVIENKLDNLEAVHGDLREEETLLKIGRETVDLVTANPPYYPENSGFEKDSISQKTARYDRDCTVLDVVKAASYLLKYGGELKMCMTAARLAECVGIMQEHSIEPKEIVFISNKKNNMARLFLISGKKGGKSGVTIQWK